MTANSALGLSRLFDLSGKTDSAYHYLKIHRQYTDTLNARRNERKVLHTLYRQQLMMEKELLAAREHLANEKFRSKELLYFNFLGASVTLLLVAIFILVLQRSRSKRMRLLQEKTSADLDHKKKELTSNLMYKMQKNTMIMSVADQLKEAISNASEANRKSLQQIIFQLDREADSRAWKDFELAFQEVNSDFYSRLYSKYPNLTPNEQKLCAFAYLNLSTKDIASITHQSPESIRMARHRLRKKLDLDTEQSLTSFLMRL